MWPMIAEPGLRCAECRHNILPGRLGLSEAPEETPAGEKAGVDIYYEWPGQTAEERGGAGQRPRHSDDQAGILGAGFAAMY